jgi:hypothetical protein
MNPMRVPQTPSLYEFALYNNPQGMRRILRDEVRETYLLLWALLRSKIDQNGTAANSIARLDIIKNVTDKPRRGKVEVEFSGGSQEHARLRFATVAAYSKLGNYSFWMMRTIVHRIKPHSQATQFLGKIFMHAVQISLSKISSCDSCLVRDDYQAEASFLQSS